MKREELIKVLLELEPEYNNLEEMTKLAKLENHDIVRLICQDALYHKKILLGKLSLFENEL